MSELTPIAKKPCCPEAAARLLTEVQSGRLADAISLSHELLSEDPNCFDALRLGGVAWLLKGEHWQAVPLLKRALLQEPTDADLLNNLGIALQDCGSLTEAISTLRKAAAQQPDRGDTLLNLGSALRHAYELDEAAGVCEQALALDCGNAAAYHNIANTLCESGRVALAIACYERALSISPGNIEMLVSLSHALLLAGDFRRGWQVHEARFARDTYRNWPALPPHIAKWDGRRPLNGHLLLVAEQGLGDAIQFVRYGKLLKDAGLRLILQCHERLIELFRSCGYFESIIPFGAPPPSSVATWFPLLSLPLAFGTQLKAIPAERAYLRADDKLVQRWRERLESDTSFRVGIAWQGNPRAEVEQLRDRSIPLRKFAPLASIANVRLFSLQKGPGTEQLRAVDFARNIVTPETEIDPGKDGFVETAALMMHMDLIVTSDTSIAHLAGALGRPVCVALKCAPDWRWLLGRDDSPWYPTMRLFRQPAPGRWSAVFSAIVQEVRRLQLSQGQPKESNSPVADG